MEVAEAMLQISGPCSRQLAKAAARSPARLVAAETALSSAAAHSPDLSVHALEMQSGPALPRPHAKGCLNIVGNSSEPGGCQPQNKGRMCGRCGNYLRAIACLRWDSPHVCPQGRP